MRRYKTIREVISVTRAKTTGLYKVPKPRYDQKTAKNHHFGGVSLTNKVIIISMRLPKTNKIIIICIRLLKHVQLSVPSLIQLIIKTG